MDKIVESVRFDRCKIRNRLSSGGAGVLDVSFRDCSFYGFVQATPRRSWTMDGCHFYNGVHLSAGLTYALRADQHGERAVRGTGSRPPPSSPGRASLATERYKG